MRKSARKKYYVYLHLDNQGNIFYVGKGTGRRAWKTGIRDRNPIWYRYVDERLNGEYQVEIYQDGLTAEEAERLELLLIQAHGDQLVNWINPGRQVDFKLLDEYNRLRSSNRYFVESTREREKTDLEEAITRYRKAFERMKEYERMEVETGLVAELSTGIKVGDYEILDRLTLCLSKLGRPAEVASIADEYFSLFPALKNLVAGKKILARVNKQKEKLENQQEKAGSD